VNLPKLMIQCMGLRLSILILIWKRSGEHNDKIAVANLKKRTTGIIVNYFTVPNDVNYMMRMNVEFHRTL
jgi:hypothetical protein